MQIFSYYAATARVQQLEGGVSEIIYCGPMSQHAFDLLRRQALDTTACAACLVVRIDKVLSTMSCAPMAGGPHYGINRAPAAVIAREDQFDMWDDYARQVARHGIMRAVFLDSFAAQAYQWARMSADASYRVAPR